MATELLHETSPVDSDGQAGAAEAVQAELVEDELLVEEISIDGMCGVY